MKKFLVSVLAIAGLVACNNEQTIVQQGPAPMEFAGAFVENATRVDPSITTTKLNKFKVWAFVENESGTVLTNETVTKSGDVWTYDNKQYWTPNHTYYFAAVAPVDGQSWDYLQNTTDEGQDNTITFTNDNGTEDLIYAYTEVTTPETVDQSMEAVQFEFNHLLSKVRFSFTNGFATNNVYIAVEDVKMVAHKKGTYAVDGTWTLDGDETVELAFGNATDGTTVDKAGVAALAHGQSANAADERFSIPANENYSYVVTFTIQHYNGDVHVNTYSKRSEVSGIALEAGKAYNFAAVITPENLDLESIEFTIDEENGVAGWEQVYVIDTADEFKVFANLVNSGTTFEGVDVVLTADIDLNNQEWTPIGSAAAAHGFMGNFDGKGHKISNLSIKNIAKDSDDYAYAGLFGVTEGVDANKQNSIKNLVIENVDIDTDGHIVAAAVAYPYYTVVENVTVQGNISIKGGNYTAGILAYTRRCIDVKNLTIEGNSGSSIEGRMTVGGVVSDLQTNGGLVVNYSNFKTSGLTIKGENNVGGISGIIGGQTLDGATVENVVIDCANHRKGIVAGSLGNPSTIKNVSYTNVTGADMVVGAPFGNTGAVYKNGDVYTIVDAATDSTSLKNAIAAGDETIYLADGTYTLASYPAGLELIGCGNNVVLDVKGKEYGVHGNVTIENVKLVYSNANYKGFQHTDVCTFKNCTIVGQPFLYGNKVTFEGCTFEQTSADAYNVWTYGAKAVEFVNCTFNSAGKSVLIYHESAGQTVLFNGCELNASAPVEGKAAIEIDSSLIQGVYEVTINNTTANGFANGSVSGNSLWNNKKGAKATITVDGKLVALNGYSDLSCGYYADGNTYTVLNGNGFKNIATDVLSDASKNVTIELADDIDLAGIEWPAVCTKAAFVLDGKGKSIKNLTTTAVESNGFHCTAMFTSTRKDTTIKNLVVENATVTGNGRKESHGAVLVATNWDDLTISDVTVKNSTVSNCDRSSVIATYLYFTDAVVKNCVVEGCTVNSIGTAGALLGMNNSHNFEATGNTVKNTTISSSEGGNKAGILIGTWQTAGTLKNENNVVENSKAINAGTETNNVIGRTV